MENFNLINKYEAPNKKILWKYQTWELRFKTKKQVDTLINHKNWKKWRNSKNIINLIPQLSFNEFTIFLEKEIEKQNFDNKNIEYYERLLSRLQELKPIINDKNKYKYYHDKIEEGLYQSSKKNNFNYLEEKIKENPKYSNIYNILKSKYIKTKLLLNNNKESFLAITTEESFLSITTLENENKINDLFELLYQWKLDSSVHLMKVKNKKLKEIYKNDSDIENYLKWKVRWRWAPEKINSIYDNLDYDTAILLTIKNFISWDINKLQKIKAFLDWQNWNPENHVDIKILIAIKLEIKRLSEEQNNQEKINSIISTLENSKEQKLLLKAISEIKYLLDTKKESKSLDYFLYKLLWASKRSINTNKNYAKIAQLKKILNNIQPLHKSKTRDFLIDKINVKLTEFENQNKSKK